MTLLDNPLRKRAHECHICLKRRFRCTKHLTFRGSFIGHVWWCEECLARQTNDSMRAPTPTGRRKAT